MRNPVVIPCSDWEEKLAAIHPDDLLPAEWEACNRHIASCPACATVLTEYREMEARIRRSLTAKHPLELPKDFATGRGETERRGKHAISLGSSAPLQKQYSQADSQGLTRLRESQSRSRAECSPRLSSLRAESTATAQSSSQRSFPAPAGGTYPGSLYFAVRILAQCLSQYTEVLPDELLGAEVLVEVHVGEVLLNLFESVIVEGVNLRFFPAPPMGRQLCSIQVNARCQGSSSPLPLQALKSMELTVEETVSGIFLELFGVVKVDEVSIRCFTEDEVERENAHFKSA
jgi:hypothetical protein